MADNSKDSKILAYKDMINQLNKTISAQTELIRQSDREYRMDYAVTATQKEILKAFNMTAANIRTQASVMNEDLMKIEKEG